MFDNVITYCFKTRITTKNKVYNIKLCYLPHIIMHITILDFNCIPYFDMCSFVLLTL